MHDEQSQHADLAEYERDIALPFSCSFCNLTAPSRSPFSSTRASILALIECSSIRPMPWGIAAFEPGLTRANFPKGLVENVRSLMLTMTSPYSSRICAV